MEPMGDPGTDPVDASCNGVDYESRPLPRGEYITAMVHLYRGELYRATSWRMRLDNTTNWAVFTIAGLLSLSFGSSEPQAHFILLVGFLLITIFWVFEARRYRFADIWSSRVRMIEENFYGPILRRELSSPDSDWGTLVAQDMFHPAFKITRLEALRARFLRNYWAIYGVTAAAWCLRLTLGASDLDAVRQRLMLGALPWWIAVVPFGLFAAAVLTLLVKTRKSLVEQETDHWNVAP